MSFWDFVPNLIEAGTKVWGTIDALNTQDQSAQVAQQSLNQQNVLQQQATAEEQAAIDIARQNTLDQQRQASPGLMQMQDIINRGTGLTPDQMRAMDDARRKTADTLQGGSLRGSARATAATIADVEGRLRDSYIQQNQNRADAAASNLSGQYFNAGKNVADLSLKTGASASQGLMNTGQNVAQGGQNQINTLQNETAIRGQAIGDIAATIAEQIKADNAKNRQSIYDQPSGGV